MVGAQPDDVFGGEAMSAEAVERLMRDASLVDAPESDGSSLFDSLQRGAGRSVTMGANLDSVYSSFTDKRGPARESRPFVVRQRLGYIPQGDGVSDVDPQNIYPASSCVFVAKYVVRSPHYRLIVLQITACRSPSTISPWKPR